jgi:hypothetical protein
VTTGTVFAVFASTTLADEPATMATLVGVIVLAIVLDLTWKWIARRRRGAEQQVKEERIEHPGRYPVGAAPGA